jgi:GTPase involved in cell partitioning and DNA repair
MTLVNQPAEIPFYKDLRSPRDFIQRAQPRKPIEIAAIGGVGFHRHMQRAGTEVFVPSLAEIDRIIEDKRSRKQEMKEIQEKVSDCYHQVADVFSKIDSNVLPRWEAPPTIRSSSKTERSPQP